MAQIWGAQVCRQKLKAWYFTAHCISPSIFESSNFFAAAAKSYEEKNEEGAETEMAGNGRKSRNAKLSKALVAAQVGFPSS